MKQKLIKALGVSMAAFCVMSFPVYADSSAETTEQVEVVDQVTEGEPSEQVVEETVGDMSPETYVIQTAEGLCDAIVQLSDEEIEGYLTSTDTFTVEAMTAWAGAKEEVGELVAFGETEVEETNGTYTVTVPGDFETYDADFIYTFTDVMMAPESMVVNVKYPLSVTLKNAAMNTIMGIGIVFFMLLFLSFVIKLMGELCQKAQKKPEQPKEVKAPQPVAAPVPEAVAEEVDDTELIAVLAAAVAAYEGTTPDGLVVRSVRKVSRRKW